MWKSIGYPQHPTYKSFRHKFISLSFLICLDWCIWSVILYHLPIVGIVVTISPSLSLYRIVVFPAASRPTEGKQESNHVKHLGKLCIKHFLFSCKQSKLSKTISDLFTDLFIIISIHFRLVEKQLFKNNFMENVTTKATFTQNIQLSKLTHKNSFQLTHENSHLLFPKQARKDAWNGQTHDKNSSKTTTKVWKSNLFDEWNYQEQQLAL